MYRAPAPRPPTNLCATCHKEFLAEETVLTPTGTWACRGCDARFRAAFAPVKSAEAAPLQGGGGGNNRGLWIAVRVGLVFVGIAVKACFALHH